MRNAEASYVISFAYNALIFAGVYDSLLFGDFPNGYSQLSAENIFGGAILLLWHENLARQR